MRGATPVGGGALQQHGRQVVGQVTDERAPRGIARSGACDTFCVLVDGVDDA